MSDSPVTPTPQTMVPKLGLVQGPRVTLDLQAAIRQQDRSMQNGNSVPSLTASQVRFCEEALKQITQKIKISGARSPISLEFDRLQVCAVYNGLGLFWVMQSENTNYRNRHLSTAAALSGVNKSKNRYTDVLAYDNTRVVLDTQSMEPGSSDYINASFIQGSGNADLPKYIATQGPLPSTVKDLWSMVLQQQCPVIVMLTCIVVGNQKKCAHYFPPDTEQTQAYGHISVTNKSTTMNQCSIARRILEVQDIKSAEPPITVVHYEYLDWPDTSTPSSTRAVRELVRALYSIPPQAGPFVVHCSAGIGRTGTFCTIDHTLRRILAGDLTAINIENTVRQFRLQRDGMVQTPKQYRFCYEAVLDELNDYVSARQQH
ncbi:hypothetical protein CY35_16G065300 [Sphagnum magellanicum]|nr:hypothetical protein CY35_16G065300 [Sphagnum magellanicum]